MLKQLGNVTSFYSDKYIFILRQIMAIVEKTW